MHFIERNIQRLQTLYQNAITIASKERNCNGNSYINYHLFHQKLFRPGEEPFLALCDNVIKWAYKEANLLGCRPLDLAGQFSFPAITLHLIVPSTEEDRDDNNNTKKKKDFVETWEN